MQYRNNRFAMIIVVVFLLAICIPLAGAILLDDKGLSYTEKRKLQQLPPFPDHWKELSDFIPAFEQYYNDQFGFRDIFLKGYARVKKIIGDHDISGTAGNIGTKNVIEGKNGWFFLNRKWDGDPFSDYRNIDLYSDAELLRATLLFAARAHWLKEQDIEYLFFFAPNKHTIYSEFLPDYISKEGDISSWDQLNDALSRYTDVHFVDLRQPLLQAKEDAAQYWKDDDKHEAALYFKMDSHWNSAGGDIAQFEIAQKIEQLFPGKIEPVKRPLDDFIMRRFAGDITLIMGGTEEAANGPALMSSTCTPETFMDYLQRIHVTVCEKGRLDALIFNDSFLPQLKPYFSDYFHRTAYFWEGMRKSRVEEQISVNKPDIVIEQRAERFLPFTPNTDHEHYSSFWEKHWRRWKDTIYELDFREAEKGKYSSENIEYGRKNEDLVLRALTDDPILYLPKIEFEKNRLYLIRTVIESEHDTDLQFFYSAIGKMDDYPSEPYSVSIPLKKGENNIYLPLFSLDLAGDLRIDPGKKAGSYILKKLEIKELDWVSLK